MHMKHSAQQPNLAKSLKLAIGFAVGWTILTALFMFTNKSVAFALLFINLPILFVPLIAEFITRIKLPAALQVQFLIFVSSSSLLGSILHFYSTVPGWDTYVHLYSGVIITWFGMFVIMLAEKQTNTQLPKWFVLSMAFAVCMGIASLWEIYEFLSDVLINTNMQVGGLKDTMIDMSVALIGAVIAFIITLLIKFPKSVLPKSLQ